jgi:hypothetical protein
LRTRSGRPPHTANIGIPAWRPRNGIAAFPPEWGDGSRLSVSGETPTPGTEGWVPALNEMARRRVG